MRMMCCASPAFSPLLRSCSFELLYVAASDEGIFTPDVLAARRVGAVGW
jgi:hypothetical protein